MLMHKRKAKTSYERKQSGSCNFTPETNNTHILNCSNAGGSFKEVPPGQ